MDTREPTHEELEALKLVLGEVLPATDPDDLTAVAVEHARAIKSAFSELFKACGSAL